MNMRKDRKIVKNYYGMIFTAVNVIAMLACLVGVVIFMYLYNSGASPITGTAETIICSCGFSANLVLYLKNDEDQFYVFVALSCYLLACLPLLYILLRALFEPSFVAGRPDTIKFWPLLFPPFLRIVYELILCWKTGKSYYEAAFYGTTFSFIYNYYLIYETLSVDDDNLPINLCGIQQKNGKPWKYDDTCLPK